VFRINFFLKFQNSYPGERSSRFLQVVVPVYISAVHLITGDSDCTARKSSVTITVCVTEREAAVVKIRFTLSWVPPNPKCAARLYQSYLLMLYYFRGNLTALVIMFKSLMCTGGSLNALPQSDIRSAIRSFCSEVVRWQAVLTGVVNTRNYLISWVEIRSLSISHAFRGCGLESSGLRYGPMAGSYVNVTQTPGYNAVRQQTEDRNSLLGGSNTPRIGSAFYFFMNAMLIYCCHSQILSFQRFYEIGYLFCDSVYSVVSRKGSVLSLGSWFFFRFMVPCIIFYVYTYKISNKMQH
jgi:hypothetical protein